MGKKVNVIDTLIHGQNHLNNQVSLLTQEVKELRARLVAMEALVISLEKHLVRETKPHHQKLPELHQRIIKSPREIQNYDDISSLQKKALYDEAGASFFN